MRPYAWILGLFLLVFGPAGAAYTKPTVDLVRTAEVDSGPMTLESLTDQAVKSPYSDLEIQGAPAPGQARFVTRAKIILSARQQGLEPPEFEGKNVRVHVRRMGKTIGPEQLREPTREVIRETFPTDDDATVKVSHLPESLEILPGNWELSLKSDSTYGQDLGSTWVRVDVVQNDSVVTSYRVRAEFRDEVKVPVVLQPIQRGKTLREEWISWETRNRSELRNPAPNPEDEIFNKKLTRSLKSGQVVYLKDLELPTMVERRQGVTIRYVSDGVTVTVPGESLDEGALGDQVKVKNNSSDQEFYAEVIGEREVRVKR